MKNNYESMVKVAIYYYQDRLTQSEIAKLLGISRPTVSNLLKEALNQGIVRISIQDSATATHKLQDQIKKKYSLDTVIISNIDGPNEKVKNSIGELCEAYVESRLPKISSLGIGWGTTVKSYVQAASYSSHPNLKIVPLMGGVSSSEVGLHSNHLVFTLSQKYNATAEVIYAPAIAESVEAKIILSKSELVQKILDKGKKVDLAIIGVGNPVESRTYRNMGYITPKEEEEIIKEKAIGDILATFYNIDGSPVSTSLSNRMIGPNLDDISNMKEVLVVANGHEKAVSIKALLKNDIINHLIIDKEIAYLL